MRICIIYTALSLLVSCDNNSEIGAEVPALSDEPVEFSAANIAAARFLLQTTFGPTEDSIAELRSHPSLTSWIDEQIALPVTLQLPYVQRTSNGSNTEARHYSWWDNVITGDDQLRQRIAFALSEIFVISDLDYTLANSQYGMASYFDMLAQNAFGNYRDLLEKVTLHPAMGIYLSMVRNEPANAELNIRPDENYAREVLQLFSVGLFELDASGQPIPAGNPSPVYTQETVEEFARVFTGWNLPTPINGNHLI